MSGLRRYVCLWCFIVLCLQATFTHAMPEELRAGVIQYEVASGNYLTALRLIDPESTESLTSHASAWQGLGMPQEEVETLVDRAIGLHRTKERELSALERFQIGEIFYRYDMCKPTLRAMKGLGKKLPEELKQEWIYYRANCFLKLGSLNKTAEVLRDLVSGPWVAYAYYNLGIAYINQTTNKRRMATALSVSSSLLQDEKGETGGELLDRVYFALGSLYYEDDQLDIATQYFRKINLESYIAPQGLYMNGLIQLEQNDFRAATQSWFAVKKHSVVRQGVAESYLAIPYAYERAGYISQALEAYNEASKAIDDELETLKKLQSALKKHGVQNVFVDDVKDVGIEWYLAKDVAVNTVKAAYYTHLVDDDAFLSNLESLKQLKRIKSLLEGWRSQLKVYDQSLNKKTKQFARNVKAIRQAKVDSQIDRLVSSKRSLASSIAPQDLDVLEKELASLETRHTSLLETTQQGAKQLTLQRNNIAKYRASLTALSKEVSSVIAGYDQHLTEMALNSLADLEITLLSHFERAEQGLIHILEEVAVKRKKRTNKLDGRYQ